MSNSFSRIKKALSMSTTLPAGSGGGPLWLEGLMGHGHSHSDHHDHHDHDGCCGHDHDHDHHHDHHGHGHSHKPVHEHDGDCCGPEPLDESAKSAAEADLDDGEECDTTSPKGGCGCC
ncbi:MAG: hypothetical protein KA099_09600 [Alphaproteobacteria bacterium]|nr:hypothetical protein [Alphaproteobacteria bacterium]MBP7759111.1 hypothetical protein [Alphaproteobacteria bacterium]MBP7762475.1 hypothetical protein [Alphaproteobacteria bacterium]MBP7905568.1 hypothetical protein [Alphaproteobacteria bacterium]